MNSLSQRAHSLSRAPRRWLKKAASRVFFRHVFPRVAARRDIFERFVKETPDRIMIFPSNLCNALCSFCAYPTNKDPKQSMPNEIAFKAVDDLIAMGGKTINFTPNLGDPLVDPLLGDKLAYAKSKGIEKTYFFTNGILLDRDGLIEKISPHLDLMRISLPGLDRDNYIAVFKVDKAEKVTRGIIKLCEYKRRHGNPRRVTLELRIDRPRDEVFQDDGMKRLAPYIEDGTLEIGEIYEEFDTWGGVIGETDLSGTMKMREIVSDREVPCGRLFENPGILPDGHVRACSCFYVGTNYDKLTLEKVTDRPLSEILYGDQHREIIADWMKGDLPTPCHKCTYYEQMRYPIAEQLAMTAAVLRKERKKSSLRSGEFDAPLRPSTENMRAGSL